MFYGSDSPATAIAEVNRSPKKGIAVGTFRLQKDVHLLDLTCLRRPLRFFEPQSDNDIANRDEIAFLNSFVRDVAKPLLPGANEHIEYVPTQVVTEWFRSEFRYLREPINGIRYPSAQLPGGSSFVLFADQKDIVQPVLPRHDDSIESVVADFTARTNREHAWLDLIRRRTIRGPRCGPRRGRAV